MPFLSRAHVHRVPPPAAGSLQARMPASFGAWVFAPRRTLLASLTALIRVGPQGVGIQGVHQTLGRALTGSMHGTGEVLARHVSSPAASAACPLCSCSWYAHL